MTDFEDRVSTALHSAGDNGPDGTGLAAAARKRAATRRRRAALTTLAASVAVAGVVVGIALLPGGDPVELPVADDQTPTVSSTPSATDSRVESWRDVSVQVPADWGYGALDDWCGDGGDLDRPVVERPGASIDILCNPVNGYGVRFFDAALTGLLVDLANEPGRVWQFRDAGVNTDYPVGSWLGYQRSSGDNFVLVVAEDRATAKRVLDSFLENAQTDPSGCATQGGDGPSVAAGTVRVCRYSMDGWLEQSELLTGADAAKAVDAMKSAPPRDPDQVCTMEISGPTILMTSADAQGLVTLNSCQGFTWDGLPHALTEDVLYWALSPGWSGGVSGDVPMPSTLRD